MNQPVVPPAPVRTFRSDGDRADHYKKHRAEFNPPLADAEDYGRKADTFLSGPRGQYTLEHTRQDGAVLRYNPLTDEFGIIGPDGHIRTYFRPTRGLRPAESAQYFQKKCAEGGP